MSFNMPGGNPIFNIGGLTDIAGLIGKVGTGIGSLLTNWNNAQTSQKSPSGQVSDPALKGLYQAGGGSDMGGLIGSSTGDLSGGSAPASGGGAPTSGPMPGMQQPDINSTVNATADNPSSRLYQGDGTAAAANNAPQSAIDNILSQLQIAGNMIQDNNNVQNVNNKYAQIYNGLDNQLNTVGNLYNTNNGKLGDIYNGALASTGLAQGITDQARNSQAASAQDLTNREVGQAQQAANQMDIEHADMAKRLGVPVTSDQSQANNVNTIPISSAQQTIQNALNSGQTAQQSVIDQANTDKQDNQMWTNATANQEAGAKTDLLGKWTQFQSDAARQREAYNATQATDLMNAQNLNYQQQLARVGVLNQMYQFEKTYGVDQLKAILGDRGVGYLQNMLSGAGLNNAKAAAIGQNGTTNGTPSSLDTATNWAANSGLNPQQIATLSSLTAKAAANPTTSGTNMTVDDILKSVSNDPAFAAAGLQNSLPLAYNFVQLATAPKGANLLDPTIQDALSQIGAQL